MHHGIGTLTYNVPWRKSQAPLMKLWYRGQILLKGGWVECEKQIWTVDWEIANNSETEQPNRVLCM